MNPLINLIVTIILLVLTQAMYNEENTSDLILLVMTLATIGQIYVTATCKGE